MVENGDGNAGWSGGGRWVCYLGFGSIVLLSGILAVDDDSWLLSFVFIVDLMFAVAYGDLIHSHLDSKCYSIYLAFYSRTHKVVHLTLHRSRPCRCNQTATCDLFLELHLTPLEITEK